MNGMNNGNILGSEAVKMRIEAGECLRLVAPKAVRLYDVPGCDLSSPQVQLEFKTCSCWLDGRSKDV